MRRRAGGRKLSLVGAVVGAGLIATAFVGVGSGAGSHRAAGTTVTPGIFTSPSSPASGSIASGSPPRPSATPDSPPVELILPTVGVRATVQPVVTTHGVLAVPVDPTRVGWWTGSARPGAETGTVIVDGHVDSADHGIGALFHLTELNAGDSVTLTTFAGTRFRYRVYARQVYPKRKALPPGLFAQSGPARLVLITCGGPFDPATRSYQDNVVVLAGPVAS